MLDGGESKKDGKYDVQCGLVERKQSCANSTGRQDHR